MPLTVHTNFMSPKWQERSPQIVAELNRLECPPDEICQVVIGDSQSDADVHVIVRRQRRSAVAGWDVRVEADTYQYERAFFDPTALTIADSIRELLAAREV